MSQLHPDQVAIRFSGAARPRHRRAVAELCELVRVEDLIEGGFVLHRLAPGRMATRERRARTLAQLAGHEHVEQVRSVHVEGSRRWFATHRVLVGLRATGDGRRATGDGLRAMGAEVVHSAHETLLLDLHPSQNLDEELRRIERLPGVEFAEPEFVVLGRHQHASGVAASRLAINQAPLRLIDAEAGWKSSVASKSIMIAVLDCGIMTSHPDLKRAIHVTFDATTGKASQSPPPWDSHGTSCAGLAAGTRATSAGVRGVADGCSLMAIRIGKTPTRLGTYVASTSWLCRGIDWAWEHGADVLSMSYGGGPRSKAVTAALARARKQGRGGKGAVLIASAGNGAQPRTPVEFPATLPWVFAVAATDDHDRPKRALSNEEPWVSASGAAVDIAAPGVGCYTTTVPDPTEGETALYTTDFSGTSASTPLVAGAAALVLGANPALTEQAVRRLLAATADKVRTVTYRRGRSNWVGSGRLNVGAAVRAALASRRS
jgi:subtilisin family serine protease